MQPVAAVAVVALRDEAVLLVKRANEPHRGRWGFPGGRIEPGETARAAARREAREETGLDLRVLDVVEVYDSLHAPSGDRPGFHYCIAEFLAVPEEGSAEPRAQSDALDARWVPLVRVEEYQITEAMRTILSKAQALLGASGVTAPRLRPSIGGLYVVTDDTLVAGRTHESVAAAAVAGGARMIQLRDKHRETGELIELARRLAAIVRPAGATLIVNDRVDVALAAGADGVHLGVADMSLRDARRLLGPGPLLGYSPETDAQAADAERQGADYLGVGALYDTRTKQDAQPGVGPQRVAQVRRVSNLPIVGIGGITLERVPEVLAAGAVGVAVVSAVAAAPDPEGAARRLAEAVARESSPR